MGFIDKLQILYRRIKSAGLLEPGASPVNRAPNLALGTGQPTSLGVNEVDGMDVSLVAIGPEIGPAIAATPIGGAKD